MISEVARATAAGEAGEEVPLEIEIVSPPSVLKVRRGRGESVEYSGSDLFECMVGLREDLEREGLLLCCQGARPDVFPTGMDRSMGDAYDARVLRNDKEESVNIFAPADVGAVGTVAAQRDYVWKWYGFDKKR